MVEVLLDSEVIELAMSLEFARKQRFKLNKIGKPISMRNVVALPTRKSLLNIQWK